MDNRAQSKTSLNKQHDEVSKSINRVTLVLIGFSLFCILTLGAGDASLLGKAATVTMPFAGTQISFIGFLVVGPIILIALTGYLHVFVGYWNRLGGRQHRGALPQIHNIPTSWAMVLSGCLLYWLTPTVLAVFAWKALPRPEGPLLLVACSTVATWLAWLQISRWKTYYAKWLKRVWLLVPISFGTLSIAQSYYLLNDPLLVGILSSLEAHILPPKYFISLPISIFPRNLLERHLELAYADLSNLQIGTVTLTSADLRYANLNKTFIANTLLTNANLRSANLTRSEFAMVKLNDANLEQADLSGAHFFGVSFSGANLQRANLSSAVFVASDLTNANLRDADLSGAHLQLATGLTCEQLTLANRWWEAERAPLQACGRKIPTILTNDPFLAPLRSLVVPPSHTTPRHPRE